MNVPINAVSDLLDNFNERTAALYENNQLPRAGARYPSLQTILKDFFQYAFSFGRGKWELLETKIETEKLQTQMQCAQFALLAVLYLIKKSYLRVSGEMYHTFLSLLFQRTALHPHTLW